MKKAFVVFIVLAMVMTSVFAEGCYIPKAGNTPEFIQQISGFDKPVKISMNELSKEMKELSKVSSKNFTVVVDCGNLEDGRQVKYIISFNNGQPIYGQFLTEGK